MGKKRGKKGVKKVKSSEVYKVIAAMAGQTFKAPSGIVSKMDEKNHHLHKSVFIGEVKADGQFNVVWKTPGPVKAKPWSPYIEGNAGKPDEPVKKWAAGGKTAVVSTINGDSNVPFYKELGNQGLKATDVPVVAFSVGEEELRGVDTKPLVGHLAAWNYFMSIKNPTNTEFIKKWTAYAKAKNLPGADKPLTNDPMEATYIGINMWKQAVEKAKSTDVDKVIAAMAGQTLKAPNPTPNQK